MQFTVREIVPDMDYIAYCDRVPGIQTKGRSVADAIGNFVIEMNNRKIGTVKIVIKAAPIGSALRALKDKNSG